MQSSLHWGSAVLFLQNKEFVCRGYDYERLEDFQQRMLGEFPQAIAMQHPSQPDDTILQSDAQCILLSSRGSAGPILLLCDALNMSVRLLVTSLTLGF